MVAMPSWLLVVHVSRVVSPVGWCDEMPLFWHSSNYSHVIVASMFPEVVVEMADGTYNGRGILGVHVYSFLKNLEFS